MGYKRSKHNKKIRKTITDKLIKEAVSPVNVSAPAFRLKYNNEYSAYCNRRRAAKKQLYRHLKYVLCVKNDILRGKFVNQIKTFANYYKLEITGKPQMWLYDLYVSGENEIIRRTFTSFYQTTEWKELRNRVLDLYGYKCMKCGFEHKSNCVDHIKPRSLFKELEFDFNNMQVLCSTCNLIKSNKVFTDYRSTIQEKTPPN